MRKKIVFALCGLTGALSISAAVYAADAPAMTVDSTLMGSAYTHAKSTLKLHLNTTVSYDENSQAVFTLVFPDGENVDDSKIDSSHAVVQLVEGEGYFPEEYIFLAAELNGEWSNGSYIYRLQQGDLELNRDLYPLGDQNSGREWSCLGGDGQGNYHFNLMVSGILYDGEEVESQTFPVDISIYGNDYTGGAASQYGEDGTPAIEAEFASLEEKGHETVTASEEAVWTWIGSGELPILCDDLADDFYVTWPDGTDASGLTAQDIVITLTSISGKTKVLEAEKDYQIHSEGRETQIALTYQNWAFVPVYSQMNITIDGDNVASADFDIASVYVYEAQQGGGGTTIDGTVVAYSFYGLANLESWEQILGTPAYVLTTTQDEVTYYYAEDADSSGYLTENAEEALTYDATEERNPQLIGNTVYITTRTNNQEVEKEIDGETVTLMQTYPGGNFPVPLGRLLSPSQCDPSLEAEPGYVIPWGTSNWITNEKWAWQTGVELGWTAIEVTPHEGKSEWKMAKGTSEQFTPETEVISWEIFGDVDEGTEVTQDGLLTISENETHEQFAVTVADADGNFGTVTVKVTG